MNGFCKKGSSLRLWIVHGQVLHQQHQPQQRSGGFLWKYATLSPQKKTWETQWFIIHHGLVGGIPTPLKNMSSWVGIMTFPIYGKSWNSCSKPPTSSITISFPRFKVYHVGEMAKKISSAGTWTIQKTLVFLRSWRLSSCKPTGKWLIPKNNWAISIHIYTLVIVSDW